MDVSCHPLHETKVGKNSWSVRSVWWPPNWGQIPSAVEGLGRSRLDFQLLVSTRFRQNPRDYPWICVSSNLDYEHTTNFRVQSLRATCIDVFLARYFFTLGGVYTWLMCSAQYLCSDLSNAMTSSPPEISCEEKKRPGEEGSSITTFFSSEYGM